MSRTGPGIANGIGRGGAVRIVWCTGGIRGTPSFPSTNVGA
jgi:LmbE family N-acetylglucosaminyl deacetylase